VETQVKEGKKFTPLEKRAVSVYLDSTSEEQLVARVTTNDMGRAIISIPSSLQTAWLASPAHQFIAVMKDKEEITAELPVSIARISIDTVTEEGVRSIKVAVTQLGSDKQWSPAKDVELKVGVQRHGGVLTAGEEETYTTDSTGTVSVVFRHDSLPGDKNGELMLVAKAEENETFGNLYTEIKAAWGKTKDVSGNLLDQRTLWSTGSKTPFWLLFMASFIILGVWGTLIYLVFQLVRIKKAGRFAAE
jgi:hypothetical protein